MTLTVLWHGKKVDKTSFKLLSARCTGHIQGPMLKISSSPLDSQAEGYNTATVCTLKGTTDSDLVLLIILHVYVYVMLSLLYVAPITTKLPVPHNTSFGLICYYNKPPI